MANSAVELLQGPTGPGGPSQSARLQFDYGGDNFDVPNNSDWGLGVPAAIINDPTNSALVIAAFDDTDDEGVGGEIYVPAGASNLWLNFQYRSESSQTGAQTADFQFRFRKINDNAAPGSWTTINMDELDVPAADVNWHNDSRSFLLSSIGMDANAYYQWELTRYNAGTDTVVDDLYLRRLRIEVDFQSIRWIPADALRSITGTDWSIDNNAAHASDSNNPALKVRLFDDTTEEAVGFSKFVPTGIGKMKLRTISRAENPTSHAVDSFTAPDQITLEAGEGDVTAEYPAGRQFVISGSTGGNDGTYTVESSAFGTNTVITTVETTITTEASPSPAVSTPYKYVDVTLHDRRITDNGAVGSWQETDMASPVLLPANELWQYDEWEIDLASLTTPIVNGEEYQLQLSRNTGGTNDDLVNDWTLLAIAVEFY